MSDQVAILPKGLSTFLVFLLFLGRLVLVGFCTGVHSTWASGEDLLASFAGVTCNDSKGLNVSKVASPSTLPHSNKLRVSKIESASLTRKPVYLDPTYQLKKKDIVIMLMINRFIPTQSQRTKASVLEVIQNESSASNMTL